ncbi:hypothetical protein A9Q99_22595 [Gammaproteobacteria bacterium 45_16_T64]|nr:hypothetical protein A9Q99_22595 [Gammaproteobacteria bacterium 45_16_T64]
MIRKLGSKILETWFTPATLLMSQLTYISKFAVATALFAVPLILVVINASVEHFQKIEQLERKFIATQRLKEIHQISRRISNFRNTRASLLLKTPDDESSVQDMRDHILSMLENLANENSIKRNNLIKLSISNLAAAITTEGGYGSEGDSVYSIFGSVNLVVEQAQRLGLLVLTEGGALNDDDVLSLNIVSMLMNDIHKPLEQFGKAETIGSFFLDKGFLDSKGVVVLAEISNLLDTSYSSLSKQMEFVFDRFLFAKETTIINVSLLESIPELIVISEDAVILDPDLETEEAEFRKQCQRELRTLLQFQDQLVDFLAHRYQHRIDTLKSDQWERAFAIGGLVFGAMYLFTGLFFSVEHSLLQLISAAKRVTNGDLDTGVSVKTRDELYQLACVFEEMRLQLKQRDKELIEMATTDGLTGLSNRKHFNDTISEVLKNASRADTDVTFLIIDIDFFKKLNDNYGHQVGDDCLVEMGEILRNVLERETDGAFRYGGEEFAILLPNMSSKHCLALVEKVLKAIRKSTVDVEEERVSFTASIGVSSTDSVKSYEVYEIIQAADQALYQAKEEGRDRYVLHPATVRKV